MNDRGEQINPTRDLILRYIQHPAIDRGRNIGNLLRDVTTNKSGLGLLFLILGEENDQRKFVISRFPADVGILAEAQAGGLRVDFLERIFMKNVKSYKAALYRGNSFERDFWNGGVTDKQVNATDQQIAYYWIREFLASDFLTTARAGTKRIARAIRHASTEAQDKGVKHELVAFARFIQGMDGQRFSINQLFRRFNLSQHAREQITGLLPSEALANDVFTIDVEEFQKHASFASVELDSGALMIAPSDQFDDIFERAVVSQEEQIVRFETEGKIVDEKIRGRK
jgi:hypothetical protein